LARKSQIGGRKTGGRGLEFRFGKEFDIKKLSKYAGRWNGLEQDFLIDIR
jgi:hypothetical protein